MPNMLRMSALKLGDPVPFIILMKAGDGAIH